MTEKRYSRMTNHYGTSRTYCTGVYDNQNNRELKNASQVITELNALHEENEQLKQRNDRQAKQLDRLYHLIWEKDWRTLTDILDDFKRCEEQLQKEWGTYGDFE